VRAQAALAAVLLLPVPVLAGKKECAEHGERLYAEQPELAGLVPGLAVHHSLVAPAVELRRPGVADEVVRELREHPVLVGHPGRGERRDRHQNASAGSAITGSAPDWMRARWSAVAGRRRAM